MLRKIPRLITPELMQVLMTMGHGDEIVFGDANFPAESMGKRVVHMENSEITSILEAILKYFPLDHFTEENVILMSVTPGLGEAPAVWEKYKILLEKNDIEHHFHKFSYLTREEFYARTQNAYAVVATGEREKFANIILKLGVVEEER